MKLPEIPVPEPVYMIEVARARRFTVEVPRSLLWGVPSIGTEAVMLARNSSTAGALTALAAGLVAFSIAVLLVNVTAAEETEEGAP